MEERILVSVWVLERWIENARDEERHWAEQGNVAMENYYAGRARAYEFILSEYTNN
jgi:hypothetical protein